MLTYFGITSVLAVGGLLLYAARKPDTFRIERSIHINAPAEKIFPYINDFRRWMDWSPWETIDPALKRRHRGAPNGLGALYEWEGNNKVGQGHMEILESTPPSKVVIQLDFIKPFAARNRADFTLEPKDGRTEVTWAMHGPHPFMMRVMSVVMNMDKTVGKNFEAGLANLKALSEK
jgi:uncharacterized protein YndB with AHSA1/START domain